MRYVQFKKCLAVLSVLVLTATGLWAAGEEEGSTAAAADKKYVTDPTTGKVVSAPEYGGTLTVNGGPGAAANTQVVSAPEYGGTLTVNGGPGAAANTMTPISTMWPTQGAGSPRSSVS